jgi:hypothetical protein
MGSGNIMYNRCSTKDSIEKIRIDFDSSKKIFFLSALIFLSQGDLPLSVEKYVQERANKFFQPYKTSFIQEGGCVYLRQELPFQWGFQPSFREQIHGFRKLSAQCSHTLLEISIEENLKLAEPLYQEV